jgi:glycosidase
MFLPAAACLLTGWWCCELTNLTQLGDFVETTGVYGTGSGSFDGYNLTLQFSNLPPDQLLTATVNPGCDTLTWDDGTIWTRTAPPPPSPAPPAWASTLSILELNALAYTSPNGTHPGDGSGTWASLMPRVAYWKQLGIKGIWLAYYNLVTRHFYGIRSVYAAIDPPVLDPGMGTEEEFQAFVDACHAADVKVFLDVIGHGLVNESHYIQEHPTWFSGGSWGMVDYDYTNTEFRAWWVNIWVTYALKFGVDGYRIDIADASWWNPAWYEIINATDAGGHPIAVWGEGSRFHFSQHDFYAKDVKNVAATKPLGCFNTIQFSCHVSRASTGRHFSSFSAFP